MVSRILGIDYGEARHGVAISDELGMLAHPLETVAAQPNKHALDRFSELVEQHGIAHVVLGLPLRLDGTEGTAAEKVRHFAEKLSRRCPGLVMHFVDERLSTEQAYEQLRDAGRNRKKSKPIVDQVAAQIILQDYLDHQQEDT